MQHQILPINSHLLIVSKFRKKCHTKHNWKVGFWLQNFLTVRPKSICTISVGQLQQAHVVYMLILIHAKNGENVITPAIERDVQYHR